MRVMVGSECTTVLVSSPGTPTTRIAASRGNVVDARQRVAALLAAAAGQRVAELVEEALRSAAGQPE